MQRNAKAVSGVCDYANQVLNERVRQKIPQLHLLHLPTKPSHISGWECLNMDAEGKAPQAVFNAANDKNKAQLKGIFKGTPLIPFPYQTQKNSHGIYPYS